jgi:aspartate-semialdehyde dehydrogenase
MTVLAILRPSDLQGQELKERLERRTGLWDELRLLSTDETEVGTLTEVRGGAAMVQRFEEGDLEGVAVAFFCGPLAAHRPLLERLPQETTGIVLSLDAGAADGRPVVFGVTGPPPTAGEGLVSPHPGALLLTHLLATLLPLGVGRAVATLLEPASLSGRAGLDELFEQTRAILAFSSERPQAVFGRQLAFNYYPPLPAPTHLAPLVAASLGRELPLAVQVLQSGVFHGIGASLCVGLERDPGLEAVRRALASDPAVDLQAPERAAEEGEPSPVEAAAREEILVGSVRAEAGEPGSYWIWAVMDNLTVGGAVNAVDLAEAVLASQ